MPEATATPAAPAAAPAAQPSTPAATTPLQDAYADLDRMVGGDQPPESSATDAAKPSAEKPLSSNTKIQEKGTKLEDSSAPNADSKKPEEKPDGKPPEGKQHISELRSAYEALKAKHKALEAEHAALRSKPPEDPEKKGILERYEAAEKRRQELENEIRFKKYEASTEYKEKYERPFVDAYQSGRTKVSSLKIIDADGTTRQGTAEDFDRIAMIRDDDAAAEMAAEMFGAKASLVLYHRERVDELNGQMVRAVEDYRKQGMERERQETEQQSRTREQMGKMWVQANQEAVEKYPQWFKPEEGDEEGNRLLEEGYRMADKAFAGDDPNLTPEQKVRLHSALRNRAAGFGRLVHLHRKQSARIAELEKELSEFKSSQPTGGDGGGKQPVSPEGDMEATLSQLDKMAR